MIDRITQETSVQGKFLEFGNSLIFLMSYFPVKTNQIPNTSSVRKICGILGTINLINGNNLVVATHRIFVGIINTQIIWRLAGFDIIPYIPSILHLNDVQKAENETYLSMLKNVLDTPYFYFSYSYDLSHSLQRLFSMSSAENQSW